MIRYPACSVDSTNVAARHKFTENMILLIAVSLIYFSQYLPQKERKNIKVAVVVVVAFLAR